MKLRTAAELMGATTDGLSAEFFDKEIVDFSIDSRTVDEGELFFALSQPDYERAGFNGQVALFSAQVIGEKKILTMEEDLLYNLVDSEVEAARS